MLLLRLKRVLKLIEKTTEILRKIFFILIPPLFGLILLYRLIENASY